MDDLRYFATAEKLIERAPAEKKEAAAAQLAKVRESLDTRGRRRMRRSQAMDEAAQLNLYNLPQSKREEVIKIILSVL